MITGFCAAVAAAQHRMKTWTNADNILIVVYVYPHQQGIKDSQFDVPRFPQSVSVSQSIVSQSVSQLSVNDSQVCYLLFLKPVLRTGLLSHLLEPVLRTVLWSLLLDASASRWLVVSSACRQCFALACLFSLTAVLRTGFIVLCPKASADALLYSPSLLPHSSISHSQSWLISVC